MEEGFNCDNKDANDFLFEIKEPNPNINLFKKKKIEHCGVFGDFVFPYDCKYDILNFFPTQIKAINFISANSQMIFDNGFLMLQYNKIWQNFILIHGESKMIFEPDEINGFYKELSKILYLNNKI